MKNNSQDSIWFVYDGKCPICVNASKYYKIKKTVGNLQLLDARENKDHPIIIEINSLRLNLDDGMVIKYQNNFYHGSDALHLMALLGSDSDWLNKINSYIFRSKILAKIFYPFFRACRNFILFCKGVKKIND